MSTTAKSPEPKIRSREEILAWLKKRFKASSATLEEIADLIRAFVVEEGRKKH